METQKPSAMLDKDGNPIVNQFGYVVSARLTDEQKADIDKMKSEGKSNAEICRELTVTDRRLKTYLETKERSEAIALLTYNTTLPRQLTKMASALEHMVTIVDKLEARLSAVQTELKLVKKACGRNQIGREKLEKERRSQKQEIKRLKDILHKRTGQKF